MFLAAVARLRFNDKGECTFDGMIGTWPFAEQRPAKQNSVNRPRGTMAWTPVPVVTKDWYVSRLHY
jgi:hypothetical protein